MAEMEPVAPVIQPLTPEQQIIQTLKVLVSDRECIELRIQKKDGYWMSGYFDSDHLEDLARQAILMESTYQTTGTYIVLNRIDPALLARRANRFDTFVKSKELTSDENITCWCKLPIDVDPIRISGVSSTDAELLRAKEKAAEVVAYLTSQGFPEPLTGMSGNGYHIVYKINMERSPENDKVVKHILKHLDEKLSDKIPEGGNISGKPLASVDIVNHNPSRIFKLYGSIARKGDNLPDRPHRRSYLISTPETFVTIDTAFLLKFCKDHPIKNDDTKKKGRSKLKNAKEVTSRHPELLKIVGKMVKDNFPDEAIQATCEATNKEFPEPKTIDVLVPEVVDLIRHCRERQAEDAKLPDYITALYDDESGEFLRNVINLGEYSNFLNKKFCVINFKGYLYVFDDVKNVYRENLNEIGTHVRDTCLEYGISDKIVNIQREVHEHLKNMGNEPEYPFDKADGIIPLENCSVRILPDGSIEKIGHSPDIKKTVRLPVVYNPAAPTEPVKAVISQWVEESDVQILIQILAQAIYQQSNRTTLKRNYLLQGETDAGKSTYLDMLKLFCGETQISDVSLQEICSDVRFLSARLESKILNVYDDLKDIPLAGAGKLKKLDGRVTHEIERKGKTPYIGNITCPHVFSCNQPPSYDEDLQFDEAWWNRWEFVSFPFSYAKDSRFQERTFTPAFMSGLLNLVLEEIVKISNAGQLTINRTSGEVRERWGMLSNPLKMWVRDNFEVGSDFRNYDKKKLFNQYTEYCETNEVSMRKRLTTEENFGRKLPAEGFVTLQVPDPNSKVKRSRIWVWRSKLSWNGKASLVGPEEETKNADISDIVG